MECLDVDFVRVALVCMDLQTRQPRVGLLVGGARDHTVLKHYSHVYLRINILVGNRV